MIVTGSLPPLMCGVGDYCMQLARALAEEFDAKVTVLTSISAGVAYRAGNLDVRPEIQHWSLSEGYRVFSLIRELSPDIVHVQYPTQGYATGPLPNLIPVVAKLAGAAVVQTWHEPVQFRDLVFRSLVSSERIVVRSNFLSTLSPFPRWALGRKRLHCVPGASALPVASPTPARSRVLRDRYLMGQRRLVVYFGFINPNKGVEHLFEVAAADTDQLVIAGNFGADTHYREQILALSKGQWAGKVTFTGYLSATAAAELLSVSDAVVLPFRNGGGDWNSSIQGATANGAYVITTSEHGESYDPVRNIAYARIDDIEGMRTALALSAARRSAGKRGAIRGWRAVAASHLQIYQKLSTGAGTSGHDR